MSEIIQPIQTARLGVQRPAHRLSIIIPAYNEERTIGALLEKIRTVRLLGRMDKEIIIVDDCSIDRTPNIIMNFIVQYPEFTTIYYTHTVNKGKGAAIRTGIQHATGDYLIIQDADLEYDPEEYNILLVPMLKGHADVVYGSRFMGGNPHRILFFWHSIGNRLLTFLSNSCTNQNLTDMETGYKLFKTSLLKAIPLRENRFGFEPEITAKIAAIRNVRIYEVGISYYGRTYQEGKKIKWRDGARTIFCILKYAMSVRCKVVKYSTRLPAITGTFVETIH